MPLVRIVTSAAPPKAGDGFLDDLSQLLAHALSKPEAYVMTCLEPNARMTFAGTRQPACYVEVKNVGRFTPDLTKTLSADITQRLVTALGVSKDRIYIEFADAQPHMWGYDGDTFA